MIPVIVDSISNAYLSPDYMCIEILPFCLHSDYKVLLAEDFAERVLADKPEFIEDNNFVNSLYAQIKNKSRKTIKAVQFTDLHVDFDYAVGSDSQCNGLLCCRDYNGYPTEPERQAGEYGSYKCDLPEKSFRSMLDYVRDEINPEVIFWTGDNAPHDIWSVTNEEAALGIVNMTKIIKDQFESTHTSIFPI